MTSFSACRIHRESAGEKNTFFEIDSTETVIQNAIKWQITQSLLSMLSEQEIEITEQITLTRLSPPDSAGEQHPTEFEQIKQTIAMKKKDRFNAVETALQRTDSTKTQQTAQKLRYNQKEKLKTLSDTKPSTMGILLPFLLIAGIVFVVGGTLWKLRKANLF